MPGIDLAKRRPLLAGAIALIILLAVVAYLSVSEKPSRVPDIQPSPEAAAQLPESGLPEDLPRGRPDSLSFLKAAPSGIPGAAAPSAAAARPPAPAPARAAAPTPALPQAFMQPRIRKTGAPRARQPRTKEAIEMACVKCCSDSKGVWDPVEGCCTRSYSGAASCRGTLSCARGHGFGWYICPPR